MNGMYIFIVQYIIIGINYYIENKHTFIIQYDLTLLNIFNTSIKLMFYLEK